ncbi:guanylate kinase domain-containing protein [Ditylenchus destructor]|uniref:Guanylate kinase domain-containing protein n=1 Tax=Ditylenchus destructor TaxID=166010 RepID=A0AAD4N9Y6_9BILA|nr:guanylate kinase domain-containing protein [Ditylenchus destructor]
MFLPVRADDDEMRSQQWRKSVTATTANSTRALADWTVEDDETALLSHHYQICDVLEKSPICTIYRATHRNTSKTYIVKSIDLKRYLAASGLRQEDVENEVEICAGLKQHPFFCQLKDVIYGNNALHMVFENVEGTDICFEVVKRASAGFIYSEAVVSHYTRQMLEAVQFLHSQRIIHRDIRPHNILLATKENNAPLKLRGFGVAYKLKSSEERCTAGRIGIPQFMAPEIISEDAKGYGTQADIWSIGVLVYILLSGRLPFSGSIENVYEAIMEGRFFMDNNLWSRISEPAKDLVSKLLTVDESERLSAELALKHPWIADRTLAPRIHLNETVENIRKYNFRRKLKSNIVSTANNKRWNRFPVNSYLSSDSMPGGDSCDFDCSLRKPDARSGDDMFGVQMVLASLDKMAVLSDYSISENDTSKRNMSLEDALNNKALRELLLLYDRIRSHGIRPSPINRNAELQLTEAKEELAAIENPNAETTELATLLNNIHLQAILQAQDVVIEEVFSSSNIILPLDDVESVVPNAKSVMLSNQITEISKLVIDEASTSKMKTECEITSKQYVDSGLATTSLPLSSCHAQMGNGSIVPFYSDNVIASQSLHNPITAGQSAILSKSTRDMDAFEYDDGQPLADDDDDLLLNAVSRVRLVQFQKDTEEPMGITLKITEDNRCFIARIMHGGMIHRQSTLHVGDEIREINGQNVANQTVESLQNLLRDARGCVQFKIVPSYRSAPPACEICVRAQFDYDPEQDDLIPCPQAGVPFKTGDILQIISKDDHNWWQARFLCPFPALGTAGSSHHSTTASSPAKAIANHNPTPSTTASRLRSTTPGTAQQIANGTVAGLIPSPELQEWRTACLAMEKVKDNSTCLWFNKKKKYYTTKYLRKHSDVFEHLDLVTYEEVIRLSSFRRKTLVLLGAHGVGRRHIKNTLISRHPQRFAYPIPHTTRSPRKDEVDGKHYFFVSNDVMLAEIQANEYLEYGSHEECMYGTKLDTIRAIHRSGKMAILDVEPQALKVLRSAEYAPFVVFIAAPEIQDLEGVKDPDGSLDRLLKESEVLRQAFGHLFDYVICNSNIEDTIHQLEAIIEKLSAFQQWVPVSWVY